MLSRQVMAVLSWRLGLVLGALTVVQNFIRGPGGNFELAPPGRFGGPTDSATAAHEELRGGGAFSGPAGLKAGAPRAEPAIPAAGLVGSAPRPSREPNRAQGGVPASPRTGSIWKNCAARRHRVPSFSRYKGWLDLGFQMPDFHVRQPKINCNKTQGSTECTSEFSLSHPGNYSFHF